MINEMKSKYGLRFKDKVDKVSTGIDLINAFMNVTKEQKRKYSEKLYFLY